MKRRRLPLAVALCAATLAATHVRAAAESVKPLAIGEHPRLPSQPGLNPDLIYEQGAPDGSASQRDRPSGRPFSAALLGEGRALYDTHCITCHGADLRGTPGVPSLAQAGGSAVDFYVATGRMPGAIKVQQAVHMDPHFTPSQIAAIDAYVTSRASVVTPIPNVVTNAGLLQHGRLLFEDNCEACHGVAAQGASAGGDWIALPLYQATSKEIGEAIRIGPGVMPRFTDAQLSDRDIDSVATYVRYLTVTAPSYGGFTMDYAGPAAEGLVGGVLGVGALFWVIFFTGTKADGTRLSKK
jgi:ubiquinol-cytochrome c reductase cytochrome c subunit